MPFFTFHSQRRSGISKAISIPPKIKKLGVKRFAISLSCMFYIARVL
jgi:hypothetical protein